MAGRGGVVLLSAGRGGVVLTVLALLLVLVGLFFRGGVVLPFCGGRVSGGVVLPF